ncbi:hypothetical protein KGF57_003747 [Candida theae]|uniref:RRM domain-containing protein n=1 Tax=Candida theae TaxID=1198502 RepID=A0AAD5BC93_9ASCO|nr:uncharacterized protein KGF57_003747 [Candida theae]KAI5954724.1 hypothetical protein KGF57_003747 [Candida theae]
MNKIKQINRINQKELASGTTSYKSSWHYEYRDTNYVFISNIPATIKPQDLVVIFSQYGIPTHLNLVKNREDTSQHRGFAFLKYAHFKSCILAIDNFNGIKIGDKMLHVDHTYYQLRHGEKEDDHLIDYDEVRKTLQVEDGVEKEPRGEKEVRLIDEGDVSELKAIEYKMSTEEKSVGNKDINNEEDDESVDPMAAIEESTAANPKAGDDDNEFVDPMEHFISETSKKPKEKRRHKSHRSSMHKSHRSHRSGDKSSSQKRDRDRSPTRAA